MGAILPTENAAGVLLVLFAHRRLPPVKALPITAALVVACLISLYVRTPMPDTTTLAFGVLQLLLAVGTGAIPAMTCADLFDPKVPRIFLAPPVTVLRPCST